MARFLKLLVIALLTGLGVAITYYVFEAAVHGAIDAVWLNWLDTDQRRLLVIPACFVLTLAYFGVQHALDRPSERHESHGLGDAPKATIANFSKVLIIGFLSLLAGASLGPEAILVPACTLLGAYIGNRFFGDTSQAAKLMSAAGLVALFAAFFNSFIIGMLGLLLIRKQTKLQLRPLVIAASAVAAASTVWLLDILSSKPYVSLPPTHWYFNFRSLLGLIILLLAGYAVTYITGWSHQAAHALHTRVLKHPWWLRALAAAGGLALLYLIGGHLVEFTGNESIIPMLQQAAKLGTGGLLWVVLVKVAAIGWSKAMGYRGGMIFPTVFVASTLVAIVYSHVPNLNFIYGLIAVLIGAFAADRKVKILV